MTLDREKFEKEGLKIDKERVLTYSGLICPLDCVYCFSEELSQEQKKSNLYLSETQFDLLKQLPKEIKLIMLGCDTEFFQLKKDDAMKILERLSNLNKDISVITKLSLSQDIARKLKEIDVKLKREGNLFVFSESITCMDSAKLWEPKAPHPKQRINTLKLVHELGIKTLVAIRPLLPTVFETELKEIIDLTKNYCDGYYSGPLYLKNLSHPLLDKIKSEDLKIEKLQPHWMPKDNIFYKIEKEGQMDLLKNILEENGKQLFEGAAEAIEYLKEHEKH